MARSSDSTADPAGERERSGSGFTADDLGLPDEVACPFCDETDTELHSAFGSALSVATYWCSRCRTAFEWVKWE